MSRLTPSPKYSGPLYERAFEPKIGPDDKRILDHAEKAMQHPAYADPDHPQHQRQVEGVRDLLVSVYGSKAEIEARLAEKKRGGGV